MYKKTVLLLIFILIIATIAPHPKAQASGSSCPDWLTQISGQCLTDQPGSVIVYPNNAPPPGEYVRVNTDILETRWLIEIGVIVPMPPVLPFFSNLNKFKLVPTAVFIDQRQKTDPPANEWDFYDGLYILTKLVCDQSGSYRPTLAFSIPKQYIKLQNMDEYHRIPRALYFQITNWNEAVNSPCSY